MKLAITADVHLKTKIETPDRWQALENICRQLKEKEIDQLVVAGDLFDDDSSNYSDFDQFAKQYKNIQFHIIPGNHDPSLKQSQFIADNIKIYQQPQLVDQGQNKVFFVPYFKDRNMGDVLAEFESKLNGSWLLIGHGNWADTIRETNAVEPGVYMPLTRKVINKYRPRLTVLGHIHKKMADMKHHVYYPGSPMGLDITETGRRSFLILDLDRLETSRQQIKTAKIYFDQQLFIYPSEDEKKHWQKKIDQLKKKWALSEEEKSQTVIRITLKGFSSDKRKLKNYFEKEFEDFKGWKEEKINVDQVSSANNYELFTVSKEVIKRIESLSLPVQTDQPDKSQIINQAIKEIYSII